ncbi:hypothetical protein [Variovorax sp. KK3]|uniref:hypothetical protein n=1 Tax=Variovorax sp. KK3 TaxID=1855728 RepID=UPI00097BCD54|nr:hypothetical protein [Variovorax sp. KK3]
METKAPSAPAKTMRSLEEVRADLARLRANAKERHAQLQAQALAEAARREIAFAPTDFLDFEPPKPPQEPAMRESASSSSFAPTAFFDLASLKTVN